jgi:3-phenylpropionate/trans-cinnamate dioxygenase ferredoxin subunit
MGFLDLFRGQPAVIEGTTEIAEGHARKVELAGKQVVLCRVKGRLYALDAACPHEGGRISEGPLLDGKHAMCPLHNYRFDPRTGAAVGGVCEDAVTYRLREKDGSGEIWL